MAEIQLGTGTPIVESDGQLPTAIVGTDPFGDDSDATYVRCYGSHGTPIPPRGSATASVETLTGAENLTDILLRIRVSGSGNSGGLSWVYLEDSAGDDTFLGWSAIFPTPQVPMDGAIYEYEVSAATLAATWGSFYLDQWEALLRAGGCRLHAGSVQGTTVAGRPPEWLDFHSFVVVVVTPDSAVTRLYPRDDGRGMSSAARIYPPSKARRIVGGYQ